MPKELKNPRHVANLSKFGHDLTKILKFSSNPAQLLPVWYDLAQAGDKYRFNTEMFTMLTQIVSPAMVHIEEHVEWFFVPLRQLYQFADDNLYSLDNSRTSYRRNISDSSVMPMISESLLFSGIYEFVMNEMDIPIGEFSLDEYGVPIYMNSVRLLQHLGFGQSFMTPEQELSRRGYNVMLLLAYQKIFYDKYRITDRTQNNVQSYNVDDLSGLVENLSPVRIENMLRLHYRPWRKDFFTSSFVSPLIDVDSVGMQQASQGMENSLEKFNNWLAPESNAQIVNQEQGGSPSENPTTVQEASRDNVPFNLALLRGMFAVEKLSEITRRAAKRYDAQVLAHFGFKVPEGIGTEVIRCGYDKSIIQVNEVVATAAGEAQTIDVNLTSSLGERGGKAAGYKENKNKTFTAPCDGIFMAIYSAEPLADYNDLPLDKFNTFSTRYDYFKPEYDRLGMQPLFWYQLHGTNYQDQYYEREVLGWQYRFMEYKMKFNQCLGAFVHDEYKYWTVFRDATMLDAGAEALRERFFYINPNILDNILLTHTQYPALSVPHGLKDVYGRDCMLHWFKFNVYKSSVISNYSLPNL